jgi:hypothetical protein
MPTLISQPTRIPCVGTKPKLIDEYIGGVNSKTAGVSVAHMRSPEGWGEPHHVTQRGRQRLTNATREQVVHA